MLSQGEKEDNSIRIKYSINLVIFSLLLFLIFLTNFYSYLLFHSIAEIFSVVIAFGIFAIGWNTRKNIESSVFLVLGVSLLFIGSIDLIHTLAYTGMNIFEGYNSNLPTQLWIAARYLQAVSFLMAFLLMDKKVNPNYLIIVYSVVTTILVILIFAKLFPVCYIEGSGLTTFKIVSEYIIIGILAFSMIILYKNRKDLNITTFRLKMLSIISTMAAELSFTFYVGTYDLSNLIGHLFKIISFYLIYLAIVQKGLEDPLNTLFKRLKESEKFTATALNAQTDTFFVFNPITGKAIRWNKAFNEISGYTDEEIRELKAPDAYYSPEDLVKASVTIRDVLSEGKSIVEMNLITKNGNRIPYEYTGSIIHDKEGNPKYIVSVGRNITDRIIAERMIKESEELFRTMAEQSLIGLVILIDGNIIYVNDRLVEIWGYSKDEFKSWTEQDVIGTYHPDDLPLINEKLKERESKNILQYEVRIFSKTGEIKWINIRSRDIKYNGRDARLGAIVDITDRKKAEKAVKNLAKFPSENPNPVLRVNREKILYSNSIGQKLFDIEPGNDIPQTLKDKIIKTFETKSINQIEIELNKKFYSFTITPVPEEDYVNIYGLDITERILAERKLQNLISTVSHELRTPITVLMMSLDLYMQKQDSLTPELQNYILETSERNLSLLKDLSEDILMISQIDEKKLKLYFENIMALKLLQNIVLVLTPFAEEKNITFQIDIKEDIKMKGDLKRIDQVFRILLDNAIKYSYENTTIKINAIENYKGKFNSKGKNGILFQIKNQGIGISEEELPFIFERFYRASNARETSGTGLGLSIAKDIIERHQGDIFIESKLGDETTFSIFFPRIDNI